MWEYSVVVIGKVGGCGGGGCVQIPSGDVNHQWHGNGYVDCPTHHVKGHGNQQVGNF